MVCHNQLFFKKIVLIGLIGLAILFSSRISFSATSIVIKNLIADQFPNLYADVDVQSSVILDQNAFQVLEDGVPQTIIQVVPPGFGGGIRVADIVIVIDCSGSMSAEIADVRNNVNAFAEALTESNINFRLGLVRFGHSSGESSNTDDNPYIFNNGNLTADIELFQTFVNQLTAGGSYEPGFLAIRKAMTDFVFRNGVQKLLLIITDEDSDDRDKQTTLDLIHQNQVTVHAAANCSFGSSESDYCNAESVTMESGGMLFDVTDAYDQILTTIAAQTATTYAVNYTSQNDDCGIRNVEISVTENNETISDEATYNHCDSKQISLSTETTDQFSTTPSAGDSVPIAAIITGGVEPGIVSATLYYRPVNSLPYSASNLTLNFLSDAMLTTFAIGDQPYASVSMSQTSGDTWIAQIPAAEVVYPGIEFYITATDGKSTSSLPGTDAAVKPFSMAILPNVAPIIDHTPPQTAFPGHPLNINAHITDTTQYLQYIRLHYRSMGDLIYQTIEMPVQSQPVADLSEVIPAEAIRPSGVEYYIEAVDDLEITSTSGTPDNPIYISTVTAGDLDHDSDVDADDRNSIINILNTCHTDPSFISEADYDGDGCITFSDYRQWFIYYKAFLTP